MYASARLLGVVMILACVVATRVQAVSLHGPQTYDRDSKADFSVYNFNDGIWLNLNYADSDTPIPSMKPVLDWHAKWFMPVPADYDGDGLTDRAVYYLQTGTWYIEQSGRANELRTVVYGNTRCLPVPHDYDGDGIIDIAVYQPKDGTWFIQKSSGGSASFKFGGASMMPVPGYYNGTNRADVAVYDFKGLKWYIRRGLDDNRWDEHVCGYRTGLWPVPADYDGDDLTDIATYDGVTGAWWFKSSQNGEWNNPATLGGAGYVPVPDDYNGNGAIDIAVYNRSEGVWQIRESQSVTREINWGWDEAYPTHLQYQVSLWFPYVVNQR